MHKTVGSILVCIAQGSCINSVYLKNNFDETCQLTVITVTENGNTSYHLVCAVGDIDKSFDSEVELASFANANFPSISSRVCPNCEDPCSVVVLKEFIGSCSVCNHNFGRTDCLHLYCPTCVVCRIVTLKPLN